ncbi:LysR family transcriptional regulator [Salinicola endophyticus]|uniref:LysR family transcriptional regulator n=1 Tax=Salinicola endophyticus TaxID=1949083 RepID=A0ABY8FQ75_9GAMM|nr:LysR family transcriptional regulator [Salinicola endophyticus]WFF42039.1 LysR family transcriptional regulator [Salinicola endophyticus]
MMNLSHWRLIVAVADTGTVSQGAARVGMTQSAASQAIAQVEKTLGSPLFTRLHREVILTAFGESVVDHARDMLTSLKAIRALADTRQGIGSGRLRLGSFPSIISRWLPTLLSTFRQRHPGVEIVLLEGSDEEVETWLADRTIDLGVVLNPTPDRRPLILGRDAWVALLPHSHPLARRTSVQGVELSELVTQPYIHASGGCRVNGQSLAEARGLTFEDVRVTVRDWASACALVREYMGIAIVPESVLPEDRKGLRIQPLQPRMERCFGLVAATTVESAPALHTFWQHVEKAKSPT